MEERRRRKREERGEGEPYVLNCSLPLCLPRRQETNSAEEAHTGDKEKRRGKRRKREETNAKFNKETRDKKKFSPAAGFLNPDGPAHVPPATCRFAYIFGARARFRQVLGLEPYLPAVDAHLPRPKKAR